MNGPLSSGTEGEEEQSGLCAASSPLRPPLGAHTDNHDITKDTFFYVLRRAGKKWHYPNVTIHIYPPYDVHLWDLWISVGLKLCLNLAKGRMGQACGSYLWKTRASGHSLYCLSLTLCPSHTGGQAAEEDGTLPLSSTWLICLSCWNWTWINLKGKINILESSGVLKQKKLDDNQMNWHDSLHWVNIIHVSLATFSLLPY